MVKNVFFEIHVKKNEVLHKTWFNFLHNHSVDSKYFYIDVQCQGLLMNIPTRFSVKNDYEHFGFHFGDQSIVSWDLEFIKHICFSGKFICTQCSAVINSDINNFAYEMWTKNIHDQQLLKIRRESGDS